MGIMILLSSHSPRKRITQWGQPGGSGEAKACGHRPDAGGKNGAKITPRDKSILSAEGGDAMGEYKAGFSINEAADKNKKLSSWQTRAIGKTVRAAAAALAIP